MTFQKTTAPLPFRSPAPAGRDALIEETPDYIQFKSRVYFRTGIDLNLYKQPQMHRRLSALVERTGVGDFEQYYRLLESDPQEYEIFLDRLTINVSELFRNPEKWNELSTKILPPMLEKNKPLRIWSAGCSYGAEPYSLTILLDQLQRREQGTGNREQDNTQSDSTSPNPQSLIPNPSNWRVTAILGGSHPSAVVESAEMSPRTVSVGDELHGFRIAAIRSDEIVVSSARTVLTLPLETHGAPQDEKTDKTETNQTKALTAANLPKP
ncbi:hypothetical protein LC607_35255 [Nostoc sp. CHAB 5824]|nr:hypothetical protein [Nostoc sp. CHAB 5824]